jgi:hypothetical protein
MFNKVKSVEVSDTTGDEKRDKAGNKIRNQKIIHHT